MNFIELTNAYIGKEENMPIYLNVDKIESFGPINCNEKDKINFPNAKSYICISGNTDFEYKVKETPETISRQIRNIKIDTINEFATRLAIKLKK